MKYVLDSDTLIYFLKGYPSIIEKVMSINQENLMTTIINHAELLFGAFNSVRKKQNLEEIEAFFNEINILPFCTGASRIFAEQKALLSQQGNIVADLDLTLKRQLILGVMHNILICLAIQKISR